MDKPVFKPVQVLLALTGAMGLMLLGTSEGWAQQKAGTMQQQLVGLWTAVFVFVSSPDGKKNQAFGSNPVGLLIFDAGGRYSMQICSSGRAKFTTNIRDKGTPEENQAAVKGCNPHWGKYTVDEEDHAIVFDIEHGMFPNWEGTRQKRSATITGDELRYVVPTASIGGTAEVVWRRAK